MSNNVNDYEYSDKVGEIIDLFNDYYLSEDSTTLDEYLSTLSSEVCNDIYTYLSMEQFELAEDTSLSAEEFMFYYLTYEDIKKILESHITKDSISQKYR